MKVLIIHQHFKTPVTGGAIRSYYLAKALVDRGHQAVVVTADADGNERTELLEGIEIHYTAVAYDNAFGFYARALSFLKFIFLAGGEARRVKGVDLCYAISVPITVSIIARWMRFWRRIPYVLEVGDLWPDAPIELGFVKNPLLKQLLFRIERLAYKNAKAIVALSPDIQRVVQSRAPGKEVAMIPNMADCNYFLPENKNPALEKKLAVQEKFVISYIGALGFANGLDYILECAQMAGKTSLPIHFILAGDGALAETLRRSATELDLKNISFLPHTHREGVKEIMNVTDAVFVCYRNAPILSTGSPNKFFDGLAAGKMIIINFGGWIGNEVRESGCGIAVQTPMDLVAGLTEMVEDPQRLKKFQAASRALALRKFDREKLSADWMKVLENYVP